jgi:hypothetical protein
LKKGSIGLAGVLMQAVSQISPTVGIFYTISFTTGQARVSVPLTYLAAFVVCLFIAVPMTGLAWHLPAAGWLLHLHLARHRSSLGFITDWLYAIMVTIVFRSAGRAVRRGESRQRGGQVRHRLAVVELRTGHPRRLILIGVFYVVCAWGVADRLGHRQRRSARELTHRARVLLVGDLTLEGAETIGVPSPNSPRALWWRSTSQSKSPRPAGSNPVPSVTEAK